MVRNSRSGDTLYIHVRPKWIRGYRPIGTVYTFPVVRHAKAA